MVDLATCPDGELAALALAGRQEAYGQLLNRHRAAVFRITRHYSGDADAAIDLTQQSFIAAFAALDRYDPSQNFAHWIVRIAINRCHDWARRRKVRQFFSFAKPIDAAYDLCDPAPSPEAQAADRQELRHAMAAIARLPARLKEVLVLRAIEGLSQREVAQVLGVSEKAVETRLYRAREKLADLMRGERGGGV